MTCVEKSETLHYINLASRDSDVAPNKNPPLAPKKTPSLLAPNKKILEPPLPPELLILLLCTVTIVIHFIEQAGTIRELKRKIQ